MCFDVLGELDKDKILSCALIAFRAVCSSIDFESLNGICSEELIILAERKIEKNQKFLVKSNRFIFKSQQQAIKTKIVSKKIFCHLGRCVFGASSTMS